MLGRVGGRSRERGAAPVAGKRERRAAARVEGLKRRVRARAARGGAVGQLAVRRARKRSLCCQHHVGRGVHVAVHGVAVLKAPATDVRDDVPRDASQVEPLGEG